MHYPILYTLPTFFPLLPLLIERIRIIVTRLSISKTMIPTFYLIHLQKQLSSAQFKLIGIFLPLIQSEKQVRLEIRGSVSLYG